MQGYWFIIDSAESIVKLLTYIVNLSIESGVFPDDLKRAKIVPIYKKKAKTEPGNYQPVSVLSIMSKVMERVIFEQLNDFIEKHEYMIICMSYSLVFAHLTLPTLALFIFRITF